MALIKDNSSLDFLPNYVTLKNGTKIDKAKYVDMAIRTENYIRANRRLPAIVYRMSKLPDYNDSTMKIAKSLGYDVQFVHVKCRVSGTGHIRLKLRHKKHTEGNWINRDSTAVADTTSGNVKAIL